MVKQEFINKMKQIQELIKKLRATNNPIEQEAIKEQIDLLEEELFKS